MVMYMKFGLYSHKNLVFIDKITLIAALYSVIVAIKLFVLIKFFAPFCNHEMCPRHDFILFFVKIII